MKKLFTTFIMLFFLNNMNAQTDKGNFLLSGSTGDITLLSNTTNNISTGIFEINYETSIGYFIADNIAVGLSYSLETESMAQISGSYEYTQANSISVFAPFVKLYLGETNLYTRAFFGYGTNNELITETGFLGYSKITTASSLGLSIGYSRFWNDFVSSDMSLGFGRVSDHESGDVYAGFSINGGISLYTNKFFPKRK